MTKPFWIWSWIVQRLDGAQESARDYATRAGEHSGGVLCLRRWWLWRDYEIEADLNMRWQCPGLPPYPPVAPRRLVDRDGDPTGRHRLTADNG